MNLTGVLGNELVGFAEQVAVEAPVDSRQKTSHDSETTCWFDLPGLVSYLFLPGSYRLLTNI